MKALPLILAAALLLPLTACRDGQASAPASEPAPNAAELPELCLRGLALQRYVGGKPLPPELKGAGECILWVEDGSLSCARFAALMRPLYAHGLVPHLKYEGKVYNLRTLAARHRSCTPGTRALRVVLHHGSPEEWQAFTRALAAPELPLLDVHITMAPELPLATLMRYIAHAHAHPSVMGFMLAETE